MQEYDLIIIGAGPLGLSLAAMIESLTPINILLLDKLNSFTPWSREVQSLRVSAINQVTKTIFTNLSIWPLLEEMRISPFSEMSVWDCDKKSEIDFSAKDLGIHALGYIIENNAIQTALFNKIKDYPLIQVKWGQTLLDLKTYQHSIEVVTSDDHYRTKLLVGADGIYSVVRSKANIATKIKPYDQQAIVANVATKLPHEKIARQVFLKEGPLAFLPLAFERYSSIVWTLPNHSANQLLIQSDDEFRRQLNGFFPYLGEIETVSERLSFPLQHHHVSAYCKPRIALLGDAAHSVHPLAGLGMNLGFLDAAALCDVVIDAIVNEDDIGSYPYLRRYERARKAQNFPFTFGIDCLARLYRSNAFAVNVMRNFGLNAVNHLKLLKNCFSSYAVFGGSDLPRFAKHNACREQV